jgi:hypothetical protein
MYDILLCNVLLLSNIITQNYVLLRQSGLRNTGCIVLYHPGELPCKLCKKNLYAVGKPESLIVIVLQINTFRHGLHCGSTGPSMAKTD